MRMSYEDAKEHLKEAIDPEDGGLYDLGMYLAWNPKSKTATLDGAFTMQDLQAIYVYMRDHETE